MSEELRCQALASYLDGCNAVVPRLEDGPCAEQVAGVGTCGAPPNYWRHGSAVVGSRSHAYLGPLAPTCTEGHQQP